MRKALWLNRIRLQGVRVRSASTVEKSCGARRHFQLKMMGFPGATTNRVARQCLAD